MNCTKQDINFVKLVMRANSDSLGFIPEKGIIRAAERNSLLIQKIENKKVGYLLFGPIKPYCDVYIWQECIDKDVRRLGAGRDVFFKLYEMAAKKFARGIKLKCAEGLESNFFWQTLGFVKISTETPNNRRKRRINHYYLKVTNDLFSSEKKE